MTDHKENQLGELPDASELMNQLIVEHKSGLYIYRGQVRRYPKHKCHIAYYGGETEVESLYPADYRFIVHYMGTEPDYADQITQSRKKGRDLRDQFEWFVIKKALYGLRNGDSRYTWLEPHLEWMVELFVQTKRQAESSGETLENILLENEVDPRRSPLFRITWSLAQHYYVSTALVDITFDPQVALWFATNEWDQNKPRPTQGVGVIYRFSRAKVDKILDLHTQASKLWARSEGLVPPPDFFLEDIRSIPKNFAARPHGQQGGSIYGFDNPTAIYQAQIFGVFEVFPFRHTINPPVLEISRETTIPENDPFLDLLREFESNKNRDA